MKKVCFIVSSIEKALAFEWLSSNLNKEKYDLYFVLLGRPETPLYHELVKREIPVKTISLRAKSDYLKVFIQLNRILRLFKPDVVHTHMRDADLIGLLAARMQGVKMRVTTRHSSTFNHVYFPAAVKWDKLVNSMATYIVAISDVVKRALTTVEKVNPLKIRLIHHGFDLESFQNVSLESAKALKAKYGIPDDKTVIGIIARHIEWKGVQYIIPAIAALQKEFNNIHVVLANATGPFKNQIDTALGALQHGSFTQIPFEENLYALYRCFDIYVHTPIDDDIEAFGQTYVEALASGIPSIFTLSGVAHEFIYDKKNALVVPHKDSMAIFRALSRLLTEENLRETLIENGIESVKQFALEPFIQKLENLYDGQ